MPQIQNGAIPTSTAGWMYVPPTWPRDFSPSAELAAVVQRLDARTKELRDSRTLTDVGRREAFTRDAKDALRVLASEERRYLAAVAQVETTRGQLRQAAEPPAPSMADRMEIYELARAVRGNDMLRDQLFARFRKPEPSITEERIMRAFLTTLPELWGLTHDVTHQLVRLRLEPNLGDAGTKLDAEEIAAQEGVKAVRAMRGCVVRASDRDAIYAAGLIEKPVSAMTDAEKVAYIGKNGRSGWMDLLERDRYMNGPGILPAAETISTDGGVPSMFDVSDASAAA